MQEKYQSDINEAKRRIEANTDTLRRLENAKKRIRLLKDEFKSIEKANKELKKEKHKWKGERQNKFMQDMRHIDSVCHYYYLNHLDRIHDEINDRMTKIENEIMSDNGIIGNLAASINSIGNEIENLFNQ